METDFSSKSSQRNKLKVVLLEDNAADALLIKHSLREALQNQFELVHFEWLRDIVAFLKAEGGGDIIFSDLNLPDSQGVGTISAIQELNQGMLPLVVMTSSLEQEEDMLALKVGAQDFLVKGSLNGETLRRVIQYAIQRNQLTRNVAHSEMRLRTVMENSPIGQVVVDGENICRYCNPAATRLLRDIAENKTLPFELNREHPIEIEVDGVGKQNLFLGISTTDFEWDGKAAQLVSIQDISRIKRKEQWEKERETLNNIKELAGAIAHEFSQHLQILDHSLEFLEKEIGIGKRTETCRRMTNRIIDLVRNLRNIVVLEKQDYLKNQILDLKASGGRGLSLEIGEKAAAKVPNKVPLKVEKSDSRKHILLVDDEPELVELLGKALNTAGFDCTLASNGQMAWEMLKIGKYDLIISDIYMPQMSGPELFNRIRDSRITTPFIFITGYHTPGDTPADIAEADDIFFKPFSLRDLVSRVRDLLLPEKSGGIESPGIFRIG